METTIALIAHNSRKSDLLNWAKEHRNRLEEYNLIGTTNTAKLLSDVLEKHGPVGSFAHGSQG